MKIRLWLIWPAIWILTGISLGLLANSVNLLMSQEYFYVIMRVWHPEDTISTALQAGANEGAFFGLLSYLWYRLCDRSGRLRAMTMSQSIWLVIRCTVLSFFGVGLGAALFASLFPIVYSHLFIIPISEGVMNQIRFAFVGGSIWGCTLGLIWYCNVMWRRRTTSSQDVDQHPIDEEKIWPPPIRHEKK